jgi:outer membrane scaffolding protein for murein synthesis (MipA/OmpV family)
MRRNIRSIFAAVLACAFLSVLTVKDAAAQTPSPLQEWQYSGGIILARLFEPDLPRFRTVVGLAASTSPVYDGARAYQVQGGPVINIQYRDIAYLSTGDGLGYNVLRGDHFQVGVAIGYDFGRKEKDDLTNLRGMGNIGASAVPKVYGTWVLSKKFPMILRVDARQMVGGGKGAIGDASVYIPLPGSSRGLVMFAGPSITMATRRYMQTLYGVSGPQSEASGHPTYDISHTGTAAVGVGFSATKFVSTHWLLNLDAAVRQIRGSPAQSPLIESRTQKTLALSVDYNW